MQSVAGDFRPNLCDLGVFVVRFAEFGPEWTGATWPQMLTLTGCKARKSVHPIALPTGWDWIFSTTEPCYVLITLNNGTEIAGYFGDRSMASSDPEHKDIYIELVYKVPEDGGTWEAVDGSLGMHIDGTNTAYIEFKR